MHSESPTHLGLGPVRSLFESYIGVLSVRSSTGMNTELQLLLSVSLQHPLFEMLDTPVQSFGLQSKCTIGDDAIVQIYGPLLHGTMLAAER